MRSLDCPPTKNDLGGILVNIWVLTPRLRLTASTRPSILFTPLPQKNGVSPLRPPDRLTGHPTPSPQFWSPNFFAFLDVSDDSKQFFFVFWIFWKFLDLEKFSIFFFNVGFGDEPNSLQPHVTTLTPLNYSNFC